MIGNMLDKLLHNMTIIIVDGGCRSPIVTKRFNLRYWYVFRKPEYDIIKKYYDRNNIISQNKSYVIRYNSSYFVTILRYKLNIVVILHPSLTTDLYKISEICGIICHVKFPPADLQP